MVFAFCSGAFSVFCTKVAYAGWDIGVPAIDFTGVSGHSFASTSVFAVAGYFLGSNFPKPAKYFGGCLGYFAGVIVGLTRVILGDHSPSEVVIGCMLGGVIAVAAIGIIRPRLRIVAAPLVFAFTVVILMFTLHGQKAPFRALGDKGGPFPLRSIHAVCARSALNALARSASPSSCPTAPFKKLALQVQQT